MGGGIKSLPGPPPRSISPRGGSAGASCACANPALAASVPPRIKLIANLRFIIPSPLLSRTAANFLPARFRQLWLSAASAESPKSPLANSAPRGALSSLCPTTPSRPPFLYTAKISRLPLAESLLWQPHGLRQPVISHQKIHLDPFARAFFIHGQPKRSQRPALHAHTQDRRVSGIRRRSSREHREIVQLVVSHQSLRFRGIRLLDRGCTLQWRRGVGHRVRIASRGIRYARCRFQLVHRFTGVALAPVYPAHRAYQHGRSSQRPRSNYCRAPHFQCHMPSAELLAQTHLHARGGLRHGGIFRERAQLNSGSLPGVL